MMNTSPSSVPKNMMTDDSPSNQTRVSCLSSHCSRAGENSDRRDARIVE